MEKLHQLFAVPFYETQFPVDNSILEFVRTREYVRYAYSYMGEDNLLASEEMTEVRDFITSQVEHYF